MEKILIIEPDVRRHKHLVKTLGAKLPEYELHFLYWIWAIDRRHVDETFALVVIGTLPNDSQDKVQKALIFLNGIYPRARKVLVSDNSQTFGNQKLWRLDRNPRLRKLISVIKYWSQHGEHLD